MYELGNSINALTIIVEFTNITDILYNIKVLLYYSTNGLHLITNSYNSLLICTNIFVAILYNNYSAIFYEKWDKQFAKKMYVIQTYIYGAYNIFIYICMYACVYLQEIFTRKKETYSEKIIVNNIWA